MEGAHGGASHRGHLASWPAVGVPYEAVEGANLKEKRTALLTMPLDSLRKLIEQRGGFGFWHDSTKLAALPTGVHADHDHDGCAGIRWSLAGDGADSRGVAHHVKNVLESFPEMANEFSGYAQRQSLLSSRG